MVSYCCCGFPLQIGTRVIAILNIVFLLIEVMAQTYYFGVDDSSILVAVLSVNCGIVIAAFFLLGASWNNKPEFILPWLALAAVKIIGIPVGWIYIITKVAQERNFYSGPIEIYLIFIFLVIGIPLLALEIYCWMVVHSYYKELKSTAIQDNVNPTTPAKETGSLILSSVD